MLHLCKSCWNMPTRAESTVWMVLGAVLAVTVILVLS